MRWSSPTRAPRPTSRGIQLPEPQAEQAGLGGGDAPDGVAAQSLQF
jgi:hypothetical protein